LRTFQCHFSLLQNTGVTVTGQLTYDFGSKRIERQIFDQSSNTIVTEFYQYDQQTGSGTYQQTTQQSNSRCGQHSLSGVMPVLNMDSQVISFNGDTYTLSQCVHTRSLPAPPAPTANQPCPSCNAPLDVVFVVDTSLSVCQASGLLSKTVQDLSSSYNLGASSVRVGIVRFSWRSWTTSPLSSGVSLNSITFPNEWPSDCGNAKTCPGDSCCKAPHNNCLGTCVSCGIRQATDLLKSQGRAGVPSAIIIVTDGYHNRKYVTTDSQNGAHSGYASADGCPAVRKAQNPDRYDTCHPQMLADLDASRSYATSQIPGVQIFSYGQYTNRGPETEFLEHTVTDAKNVFVSTQGWDAVSAQTTVLAQVVCGVDNPPCQNCAGFCSLGKCVPLTPSPKPPAPAGYTAAATDTTVVGESSSTPDSTTTTTTITSSDSGIPGWGVALLALVSLLVVLVIINLVVRISNPGGERV